MQLISERTTTLQGDAPGLLGTPAATTTTTTTMMTTTATETTPQTLPSPGRGGGGDASDSSGGGSGNLRDPPRPDSLNLEGWCVVSQADLTKEMLQHVNMPTEIASLAASYLTRQLFSILEGALDPSIVDQIYKALQEVNEHDEDICRNFLRELNDEMEPEGRPHSYMGNDNDNRQLPDEVERQCQRSVVKVMLEFLRFSPVPVEQNVLWMRLLSLLCRCPASGLSTLVELKVAATVLGTMAVHVASAEIQRWGCSVLAPLAKFRPTPELKAPVRESGIEVLLRTLQAHMSDSTIVLAVCIVLANLASTMSQFTSWAVQQGYPEDDTERLVATALSITDYIKENGLTQLDRVGTVYGGHADIQTEFYRIMACFGYHSPSPSPEDVGPFIDADKRKHSILKSPDSPRLTCPQRRVTFSYDLDTRVEYQCSDDSETELGAEDPALPKRHTVCGGERPAAVASGQETGEAVFLEAERPSRLCKGRTTGPADGRKQLSFPQFEMEEDYLQMWQHILGEGLFSSICCDLAKLERDFEEMGTGSGSVKSGSSNSDSISSSCETVDLLDGSGHGTDMGRLVPVSDRRTERGAAAGRTRRFATVPAYRYDFYQPDWQVQDTDAVVRSRLSSDHGLPPPAQGAPKARPKSEPSQRTHFEDEPPTDSDEDSGDGKTFEYSEIDLVEALVKTGQKSLEGAGEGDGEGEASPDEEKDKAELENKGNEEREQSHDCLASEKTLIGSQYGPDPNSNRSQVESLTLDPDLLPLDRYLENQSLADDILSSFGIYENLLTRRSSLEPVLGSRGYGSFGLHDMSKSGEGPDDVFFSDDFFGRKPVVDLGGEHPLGADYDGCPPSSGEATRQAFAKALESLRKGPRLIRQPSLASSPTSSVSSTSLSLAEWSDLEALSEAAAAADEEESESVASMDTVTTQDTPPNSEGELSAGSPPAHGNGGGTGSTGKPRKLNFMHRFSERRAANYPPPPKPRRTWYYRSSADVRKSLVSTFPLEPDAGLGGAEGRTRGHSRRSGSKRGLSLLAFGKSSTSASCDSGVMTGDDDDCGPTGAPTSAAGSRSEHFSEEPFYEEVYMSRTELRPTLYERLSRRGHYAEVKKASKAPVQEENSSEATYAVCTLWVNKQCVEALVSFDHLTKQLVSPYSIVPAVRQLEGARKSSLGDSLDEMESDYPAWTSILNVLATEESKWTLSLAAQVLPIIDRLFYTKDEAIMDASVGLVQVLIRKFGAEIEKHHSGGLFRTRFRDDCRTCFLWLSKLYSRVSELLKRDARRDDDLDSLLHLSLLSALREALKPFNGRISRGMAL